MSKYKRLEVETLMAAQNIASSGTGYSSAMAFDESTGEISVLLIATEGQITVTQQCGLTADGTFYDPLNAASAALGSVIANLASTTTGQFVHYDPVPAPFIRFKVVENGVAATTTAVTLTVAAQKEV